MNTAMKLLLLRVLAAVALLLLVLPTGPRASQAPAGQPPIIRARVEMVNLLLSVIDKRGRLVSGLTKGDFEVLEDGKPQSIEFFSFAGEAESLPVTMTLLVDTSGSIKQILPQASGVAYDFLEAVLRPDKDIVAVIQFDSTVTLVQDFTADLGRLKSALQTLRAGGSTSLYDAVYLGIEEKLKGETGRRVLVIVSDGDDTSSTTSRKEVIDRAQKSDVVMYAMGIRDREFPSNFDALKDLTRETGGDFFPVSKNTIDMQKAMQAIQQNIVNQYNISYRSTNATRDGKFRRLQVRLKKDGHKARHRAGYYGPSS